MMKIAQEQIEEIRRRAFALPSKDLQPNPAKALVFEMLTLIEAAQTLEHNARFELRQDEDTGRLYWWGAEDGWKDPTEIGENGVLTLDAQHFAVGTILTLAEPCND